MAISELRFMRTIPIASPRISIATVDRRLSLDILEHNARKIAFARIGQDHDGGLARERRLLGDPPGHDDRGAARDPAEHAFLSRQTPVHFDRFLVRYEFHPINHRQIQCAGTKACADAAFDRARWIAALDLRQHRRLVRVDYPL